MKSIPYQLKQRENLRLGNWNASDVVYLLMPDRWATGTTDAQKAKMYRDMKESKWGKADMDRRGGDIAGMEKHLDYLEELGVTAVWPTPLFVNDMEQESYQGYAITNYYETDPRFGTNEEYKHWVKDCHERGLKVIQDIVFNHCGINNFLFSDLPAKDWFSFDSQYTQTTYKTATPGDMSSSRMDKELTIDGWFTKAMPDFNGKNPLVADYLIQASIWWVEYAGIDGQRQDTYPYNDFKMMKRWCMTMDREYPGFNIVGETWINNTVGVAYWQAGSPLAMPNDSKLRTVMDFPMWAMLNSCVDEETDTWDHGFARLCDLVSQDRAYGDPNSVLIFLANHDTNRFQPTKEKAEDVTRYRQALALLLTMRGIPQLYYGDELGMYANKSVNDGALRETFPGGFPGDSHNAFTKEGRTPRETIYHDYTQKLLLWRKSCPTVQKGRLVQFTVRNGVYVYARVDGDKVVTVIANGTKNQTSIPYNIYKEVLPCKSAYDVISGTTYSFSDTLTLEPKQIVILDYTK